MSRSVTTPVPLRARRQAPRWVHYGALVTAIALAAPALARPLPQASPRAGDARVDDARDPASAPWTLDAAAPGVALPALDGARTIATRELRGRTILLIACTPSSGASRATLAAAATAARRLADVEALTFLAVARELHPERARDLAAWLGVTFPVLWDPFVTVAPERLTLTALIDPAGVVRALDVDLADMDALRALVVRVGQAGAPAVTDAGNATGGEGAPGATAPGVAASEPYLSPALVAAHGAHPEGSVDAARAALSRVLWLRGDADPRAALCVAVAVLERRAAAADASPYDRLRAGLLRRFRSDLGLGEPGDLGAACEHWRAAATLHPAHAVLARPLQQFGPRLAKPEAFYAWLERARYELEERGEKLLPLRVALTEAEQVEPSTALPRLAETELAPDPEREVVADEANLCRVEGAAVPLAAPGEVATARVHLTLSPIATAQLDPDAPAPVAWIVVPQGWGIDRNHHSFALSPVDPARRSAALDFEVLAPAGVTQGAVRGYVLVHLFDREGRRVYVRRELHVPIALR